MKNAAEGMEARKGIQTQDSITKDDEVGWILRAMRSRERGAQKALEECRCACKVVELNIPRGTALPPPPATRLKLRDKAVQLAKEAALEGVQEQAEGGEKVPRG